MTAAKRITSKDVAQRAGVSRTTVSFVLNNVDGVQISPETRQRVLQAAAELNYIPDASAQSLASGRAHALGLVMSRHPRQIASDAFLSQMLDNLVREANRCGMRILLEVLDENGPAERFLNLIRSKRMDGILYSGPRFDDAALEIIHKHKFPTVLMGQFPGAPFCWVDVDSRAAAKRATEHLIRLGHQRVGCITNAMPTYTASMQRLSGYQDALSEAGIPLNDRLVRFGDFDLESGYQQMTSLLQEAERPTAVFVASDVLAAGALAAARQAGLNIPRDLALVGFDDIPLARYLDPPLTTIHLPVTALVSAATEMLFQLIEGQQPEPANMLLDTHLVIRRSCGLNAQ